MVRSYEWYKDGEDDFVYAMCDNIIRARELALNIVDNMKCTQAKKDEWKDIVMNTEPVNDKCFISYDRDLDDGN